MRMRVRRCCKSNPKVQAKNEAKWAFQVGSFLFKSIDFIWLRLENGKPPYESAANFRLFSFSTSSCGLARQYSLAQAHPKKCVCASVAHDFSIDLSGKHMPTKSYQKHRRISRVGLGQAMKIEDAALLPNE